MSSFNFKRAVQCLNYFATKEGGKINKMKAIKLIWLSDRLHIRKYGKPITFDKYVAMKNGPVPSSIRDFTQDCSPFLEDVEIQYRDAFITPISKYDLETTNEPELKVLAKTNVKVMDEVYQVFGDKTHFELSDLSHNFPEWHKYKSYFDVNQGGRKNIDMIDFFKNNVKNIDYFNEDSEIVELSKGIYQEDLLLENA